ncbi:hypothetical protein ACLB2K_026934 [Fragaria x ananassa]
MPHLSDPKVIAAMTRAVSVVSHTRSVLNALGPRPDHEAVDTAKAKLALIDSSLSKKLEDLVLSPYQLEALDAAIKHNTIVFLETGSGKTLIAIMLLRSYSHMFRKPSPFISIFLVPQVPLVKQLQFGHSDLPRIFGMTASPIKSKGLPFYLSPMMIVEFD